MDDDYDDHVAAVKALEKAEELYSSMEYNDAYGPVLECLELDPELGRAWELNGMLMLYYGDMEGARTAFFEATTKKGHYPEARWGLNLMESDKWPRGEGPDADIARYSAIGTRLLNDRIWKGAALCFNKIMEMAQPHWKTLSIMGLIYREMVLLEPSLKQYQEAASFQDAPAEIYFDMSVVLIKLGKLEEAENLLVQILDQIGPSPPVLNNLGTALEAQGREDEAFEVFEEAIEMDPKYYPALYSKGRLLQKMGKMDEAREVLGQALDKEGRVFNLDDVNGRESRESDDDIHMKEVMVDREMDD
jgi:tetratricopeptide (TPR) repeat protein